MSEADSKELTAAEKQLAEQVEFAKNANHNGLTSAEAKVLFEKFGPNELPEEVRNPILVFLSYFWGPMPIMIWIAIIVELVKAIIMGEGWEDFGVLLFLQFANAIVGFWEENKAGNAIAALKSALKPKSFLRRDGEWKSADASSLVPGDLIQLKIGDVIPADCIYIDKSPLEVDQAALTGESLPVNIHQHGHLKMGSALKRGEGHAIVVATGQNTFLGTAARLMNSVVSEGHLARILLKITMSLLILSIVLCVVIFARLMTVTEDDRHMPESDEDHGRFMSSLAVVIVILVASIPIAIEVVCTSTLAVGSHSLSDKKVIVARLSAIEELAGMTILCSDKTGTLTQNALSLREPIKIADMSESEVLFWASLSAKRDRGNQDAIDFCICEAVTKEDQAKWETHKEINFEPFNPIDKRTLATVQDPEGRIIQIAKGAPHVILNMSYNKDEIAKKVTSSVQELADRGFRALGVAINRAGETTPKWELLSVLSLFDPPRHDTKATIAAAIENGIEVKMITGDHTAIAKETCRELGMGTNILNTGALDGDLTDPALAAIVDRVIVEAHGFAEVMPEHKFLIVERLRMQGHVTGMTGDGVNDAPALKRADVGIAVHGSTDAARAAADLVLTEPGLSVIIDAIFESRKIFQRMRNYIIYRIACTVQLLFFFFFAILCINPDSNYMYGNASDANFEGDLAHPAAFTIPVISLVLITILNDGCMITIAYDKVMPEKSPQKWALGEITFTAVVLGLVACVSSLILLAYGMHANARYPDTVVGHVWGTGARNYLVWYEVRTIMYLKISISDFMTLFSARTRSWFWERRPGYLLLGAATVALTISTLLSLWWGNAFQDLGRGARMANLKSSETAVVATWVYCLLFFVLQDIIKVICIKFWERFFADHSDEGRVEMLKAVAKGEDPNAIPAGRVRGDSINSSVGKNMSLPLGVDLNMILDQANQESIRLKKARENKKVDLQDAFAKPKQESDTPASDPHN